MMVANSKKDKLKDITSREENSSQNIQKEYGGQIGPEPTRYGDWEKNGRVTDF